MSPPGVRAVVLAASADALGSAGMHESALPPLGRLVPLTAPPIHASRPLELQALGGAGCGAMGVFDDWRKDGYVTGPADAIPLRITSLLESAREAGIPVREGLAGDPSAPAVVLLTEAKELPRAAVWAADVDVTTLWVIPWRLVPARRLVNPNALLVAAGLLDVDDSGRVAWSRSLAFHIGHGQLWVNLRGREPEGIVQPGPEYEETRAALRALIRERLVDPGSGEPAAHAFLKEEVYAGAWLWQAPDLVLSPEAGFAFSPAAINGQADEPAVRPGAGLACAPGWWSVTGGGAPRDEGSATLDILSVAPTIAAALGFALTRRAAGRIAHAQLAEEFWTSRPGLPAERRESLSPEEERLVARRLGELGYLE